ncbi:hypothetical protein ACQ4PT_055806 [Festuca glaucescens]
MANGAFTSRRHHSRNDYEAGSLSAPARGSGFFRVDPFTLLKEPKKRDRVRVNYHLIAVYAAVPWPEVKLSELGSRATAAGGRGAPSSATASSSCRTSSRYPGTSLIIHTGTRSSSLSTRSATAPSSHGRCQMPESWWREEGTPPNSNDSDMAQSDDDMYVRTPEERRHRFGILVPIGQRAEPGEIEAEQSKRVRNKRSLSLPRREREMASAAAATATPAAATDVLGEVIAIHSLEAWTIQIEEANAAKRLVVIDFTASWCPPCRVIAPVFADLAKKFPHVAFLKVDVDELKPIAEQFSVEAMPTFLFMKEGDVKDRVVGAAKDELTAKLGLHASA